MKLFYSPTSPFVRKVMACAIAREIDKQITLIPTNPHVSPAELLAVNPLSKVPALVTEDGVTLFDSPVICEYLDSVGDLAPMFPREGSPLRWHALRLQALGDGLLDAAVLRRGESTKPQEAGRDAVIARQKVAVERALAALDAEVPGRHVDIGYLTVGCALGYLDLRFAVEDWRVGHKRLAAWYETAVTNPALARTVPKEG